MARHIDTDTTTTDELPSIMAKRAIIYGHNGAWRDQKRSKAQLREWTTFKELHYQVVNSVLAHKGLAEARRDGVDITFLVCSGS